MLLSASFCCGKARSSSFRYSAIGVWLQHGWLCRDDRIALCLGLFVWFRWLGPARMIADTPGGGGWGDAFEREPSAVLRDVMDDVVSAEGARRDYGVVIGDDGRSVDVDRGP